MPVLFFSEYRPDVSDYEGNSSRDITNVVPRGDGYGPLLGFSAFTGQLPAACYGSFAARKNDGTIAIFAGTSTNLYMLNNTTGTWTNVSLTGGPYTTLALGTRWQFAQFNNFVFATHVNVALQIFDLTSSATFINQIGGPPQAAYLSVVNSFLVLSGIATPNVYRIQWSGLNDVSSSASFTSGINSSDYQDLADGGIAHAVAGGEYGVIFQDSCIRRLLYSPGAPYVFQIDKIAVDDGLLMPYTMVRAGNNIFWLGPQGFKMLPPGGVPTPIGKERVDRTFQADYDPTHPELILGFNDPTHTRVMWAYKSLGNSSATMDKLLTYDWALDRWTITAGGGFSVMQDGASLAQPAQTLEGVDAAYGQGILNNITSYTTAAAGSVFTAVLPGTYEPGGVAPNTLTKGLGVQITVSATSTSTLPAALIPGQPYYIAASNLTTSTFSLTTSGGIGTDISTTGSTTLITLPATVVAGALKFAVESEEALSIGTLDSISNASLITVSAVSSGYFGFFNGPALQATLETPEQGGDRQRIFNRGFRVVSDATTGSIYGSASYRENPQATYKYTPENTVNAQGYVPLRVSTRYTRNKIRIPQATTWSYAAGVEADNAPDGRR